MTLRARIGGADAPGEGGHRVVGHWRLGLAPPRPPQRYPVSSFTSRFLAFDLSRYDFLDLRVATLSYAFGVGYRNQLKILL